MLIVTVLFALVLLRWGVLAAAIVLLMPRVRDCPACFRATVPVRRPWLRRLLPWIEWRWCLSCGWEGPGRRAGRAADVGGRIRTDRGRRGEGAGRRGSPPESGCDP